MGKQWNVATTLENPAGKIRRDKNTSILNRKINVNFYESWKTIDRHLKNNILNGIILHGGVEL